MVFDHITAPLQDLLKKEADLLKNDASVYKLSLYFFTINLIYTIINDIGSISLLVTETKTSLNAKKLGLVHASKSMYSEAFGRYNPEIFKRIFLGLLECLNFLQIPELEKLGRFILADGSVFPAFKTMDWATYKSSSKALKLHLAFELNRMIPVQFISTDANGSEKAALLKMLESGVTYIADRGYVSFKFLRQISQQQAFFIIRIKSVIKCTLTDSLEVVIPEEWRTLFSHVSDSMIYFSNEKEKISYRLVSFCFYDESYRIATNRLDLTTGEIIMLYAYRWQIELFFRSIKRTFHALHLWSHSEKGIEIQFYLYMIVYLLLLHFKQNLIQAQEEETGNQEQTINKIKNKKPKPTTQERHSTRTPARGLVTLLGEKLRDLWKMSIHWIKCVQNVLFEFLTPEVRAMLIATK